jgi:hypothetical protein
LACVRQVANPVCLGKPGPRPSGKEALEACVHE